VLEGKSELCRNLIAVAYNDEDMLSQVTVDSAGINIIKTAVSVAVMDALESTTSVSVGIPLGTFLGLDWLSGWGPIITVPMSAAQSVFTSISSTLEERGINQSAYRVNIHINVNLWIVTPAGYASVTVESDYPVTEMVLFGKVPNNLTEVYGDSQDTIGEIFDYGTIND
jgi:sporulation protein YunB